MSRALVTFAHGPHERLLEVALPSFQAFADAHGHDLIVWQPEGPLERPASWYKLPALSAALQSHDEALWLDADVVIIDGSEDLALEPQNWHALVEHHTNCGQVPNCGVWLVSRRMLPILERMWEMTEYLAHGWWEQAALLDLMGYRGDPLRPPAAPWLWRPTWHVQFLDAGWNVHRQDERKSDRPRIMHATMYRDRFATMQQWAAIEAVPT